MGNMIYMRPKTPSHHPPCPILFVILSCPTTTIEKNKRKEKMSEMYGKKIERERRYLSRRYPYLRRVKCIAQ